MIKINLLPPERRKKLRKVKPVKARKEKSAPRLNVNLKMSWNPTVVVPVVLVVLSVILVAGSYVWLSQQEKSLKKRMDETKVELNHLNRVILNIDGLKKQTEEINRRMEVIMSIDSNKFLWPQILDQVSSSLPRYTWLESLSEITPYPNLVLRIEGTTMTNLLLSRLLENLENSELLEGVTLISSVERKLGNYETQFYTIEASCALNRQPGDSTAVAAKK